MSLKSFKRYSRAVTDYADLRGQGIIDGDLLDQADKLRRRIKRPALRRLAKIQVKAIRRIEKALERKNPEKAANAHRYVQFLLGDAHRLYKEIISFELGTDSLPPSPSVQPNALPTPSSRVDVPPTTAAALTGDEAITMAAIQKKLASGKVCPEQLQFSTTVMMELVSIARECWMKNSHGIRVAKADLLVVTACLAEVLEGPGTPLDAQTVAERVGIARSAVVISIHDLQGFLLKRSPWMLSGSPSSGVILKKREADSQRDPSQDNPRNLAPEDLPS